LKRVSFLVSLILAFAQFGAGLSQAQNTAKDHFHFAGPMSAYMLAGTAPGRVASGLQFTLVLRDKGGTIAPDHFELKGGKWTGDVILSFGGLKYEDGKLKGSAHLRNVSGSVIEGVRLDIVGATEEYKGLTSQGKDTLMTRSQGASLPSPLLFGDIPSGQEADSASVEVGGLVFNPETAMLSVHGLLSGLYYLGGFEVLKLRSSPAMDVGTQGDLFFVDVVGRSIVRTKANGSDQVAVVKLPDQCLGVAVDRKTGDVYATAVNNTAIFRFSSGGELKGKIEAKDGLHGWTHNLRFSPEGTLYSDMSGSIVEIVSGKAGRVLSQVAGERIGVRLFDIDTDGNIWLCTSTSFFRSDILGKNGKRIATGPDWHLGSITTPNGCRVDADGQVYVTEGEDRQEAGRISVFDKTGKLVRVFGLGNKTRLVGKLNPGQVSRATDIAFGPDGRVYILHSGDPGSKSPLVLMFLPF
jgi:sugar lactone lactonase YvrE